MKSFFATILMALSTTMAFSQQLTQTVRGTLTDSDSKSPLIGATVLILGSNPVIGTSTDLEGKFRLNNIPTGRITLQLSYLGYEPKAIPDIVVNSAKEVILNLSMQESASTMNEVVITADKTKGQAINDMTIISARSISPEETNRYAGGFNDPSRIMSNFAGVNSNQDGSNAIIVRGNSPKYVQWRLEGMQITNPNHWADQSGVGGVVSTLNNNLLAASDFYTGAFSPEYGDVLSGVYDVKLRAGNNEKFESVLGVGLLGTDLTLEGPFKKGYGGSFLINYRYSTISLISELGMVNIGGAPKFQDAAFKVVLPTNKLGTFSLFSLGGLSSFLLKDVTPAVWGTPGDRFMISDIREDFDKGAHLLNNGLNHTFQINQNSFINTNLSYSNEGVNDKTFESKIIKLYNERNDLLRDSVVNRIENYNSNLKKSAYRGAITYDNKLNAKNKIQVGTKYALFNYNYKQSQFRKEAADRATLIDFNENVSTVNNFISWKHRINEDITIVSGVHNMNVLLNKKSTLEPRIAVNWKLNNSNSIHGGYGKHSNMESIHNYFAKVEQADGTIKEPNLNLGLLKAHHFVLGYEKRLSENLVAKAEVYYQNLYNLPVENSDKSNYATINENLDFKYVDLVNKGTGKNYGIELTLEKFFNNNYYYLINTSIFNSKYKALDGVERNTAFNSNYLVNILFGKEFTNLGKKDNQALGLNAKIFFGGGQKIIPLLRDEAGNLAVDLSKNKYWDTDKAYEKSLGDTYQIQLSASYKWNKLKTTHELFLNMDNVTNTKGKISEFYDASEPKSIAYVTQLGLFPNLMYRLYF
ncbi:TonB-dependent receptor [Adhaeribacter aquaticus]|uniref:TonB-dependent receptor n=1 Tax=Adhaeribacter aquaticus TaxID=299567 RepID=UPI00047E0442|nr:TonB-dependent receptor [Adhaeribacter aquaticus]